MRILFRPNPLSSLKTIQVNLIPSEHFPLSEEHAILRILFDESNPPHSIFTRGNYRLL